MNTRLLLGLSFTALLALAATRHFVRAQDGPPLGAFAAFEPGVLPTEWIRGLDCATDPLFQVHAYNEDFYIIRQSKCETFEAPFLFLIFGDERALLMDTGSNPSSPVAPVVFGVIDEWLARNRRTDIPLVVAPMLGPKSMPLVVAHTHGHGDHVAGDAQFTGDPRVEQFVSASFGIAIDFWGFEDYPNDTPTIDLGNRVIDVLGTPGHHPASVTLYDRRTGLLLTGDIVYPGHLFVFSPADWGDFRRSMLRLVEWADTHGVTHVLGCHIEMSPNAFAPYAWGTGQHPDEHSLEFGPEILDTIRQAADAMGNDPECTIFDEFVIHPVYKCGITWNG